ncbi:MAG: hypothetical protein EXR45_08010, partial [Chloroflexi bacterium]|nr:hypothetical protein [Chloroflexota bacterium]
MITLERLTVVRYKRLRKVDIAFPDRASILIEGNNEAGKSTLFEAIHFGLFGEHLGGCTHAEAIPHDADFARVSVVVRIDLGHGQPDTLRVDREIRTVGRRIIPQASVYVLRGNGESERVSTVSHVNRRIITELGGLTSEALLNSCFVPQKQLGSLEVQDRRQREASVASLLNLDRLTKVAQSLRPDRTHDADLRVHEARLKLARATADLQWLARDSGGHTATLRLACLRDRASRLREAQADLDASRRDLAEANGLAETVARRLEAIRSLDDTIAAWGAVRDAHAAVEREAGNLDAESKRLDDAIAAGNALRSLRAVRDGLVTIRDDLQTISAWASNRQRVVNDLERAIAGRDGRIRLQRDLREILREEADATKRLQELRDEVSALEPGIQAHAHAKGRADDLTALLRRLHEVETRRRAATVAQDRVDEHARIEQGIADLRVTYTAVQDEVRRLGALRDAVTERQRMHQVRTALGDALQAVIALREAERRVGQLQGLVLGVLDNPAGASPTSGLVLRLAVSHERFGAQVVSLHVETGHARVTDVRDATGAEIEQVRDHSVPVLAPPDLDHLREVAETAKHALASRGEPLPSSPRAAEVRLRELDDLLTLPVPEFDATEREDAKSRLAGIEGEGRARRAELLRMGHLTGLERVASDASSNLDASVARCRAEATALGIELPTDHSGAVTIVEDARRIADEEADRLAREAGGHQLLARQVSDQEDTLAGIVRRRDGVRDDLSLDDDESLATSITAGEAQLASGDDTARETLRRVIDQWRTVRGIVTDRAMADVIDRDVVDAEVRGLGAVVSSGGSGEWSDCDPLAVVIRRTVGDAERVVTRFEGRADEFKRASDAVDQARARHETALSDQMAARNRLDAGIDASNAKCEPFGIPPADRLARGATPSAPDVSLLNTLTARVATIDRDASERMREEANRSLGAAVNRQAEVRRRSGEEYAGAVVEASAYGRPIDVGDPTADACELADVITNAFPELADPALPDRATLDGAIRDLAGRTYAAEASREEARVIVGNEDPLPVESAEASLRSARIDLEARRRATLILETTRKRMIDAILPDTQNQMAVVLPRLTANRYKFPRLDSDFKLEVWDERKNGWVRRSLFSGGTQDQFSLSLRLGFAIAALPREVGAVPGFLFLDEPLSSFDRDRTLALVDLLRGPDGPISSHFRQVFLISHSQAFDPQLFTHQIFL